MGEIGKFLVDNMDLITTILAVASFVLTIGQILHACWNQKTQLAIEIQNYEFYPSERNNKHIFLLTINNASSNPVAITKIFLLTDNGEYPCHLTHQWHGERYYPSFPETDIPHTERVFTTDFPIQLVASQSFMGYVSFPIPPEKIVSCENREISFKIITDKKIKTLTTLCPGINNQSLSL